MKKKTKLDDILRVLVQESLDAALKDRAGVRYHQQMKKDREIFEEPDLGKFLAEDEDAMPEEDNEIPGSQSAPTSQAPQPAMGQSPESGAQNSPSGQEKDQIDSSGEKPESSDDQRSEKDDDAGASFDTVKDAINTLRSGKSLKDEETKRAALDYYDSLTQEEREAMVVFFRSIGDILRGEAGEKIPPSPDDPPTNLKIQKDDGAAPTNSDQNIEMGDDQIGGDDGEEMFSLDDIEDMPQDPSQVPQQTSQAPQAQTQMPQMDLSQPQQPQSQNLQPQVQSQQPQIMPQSNPAPLPPPPPEAQEDTTPPRRTPIRVNESQDLKDLRIYIRERMKR